MTAVLQPGSTFAGYEIQSRVGQGGMAVVYLAWDPHLERKVALKILNEALSEDESFQQRFIRESKMAASLGHPNVVPVFSAGESDGVLYIAMQYVEGIDLKVLIRQEHRLDPARTLSIVGQVGRALDAAHRLMLTHRDVKPANILIVPRTDEQSDDQAYLTDFGLTKRGGTDTGLTVTGQFLGTLDYVAPEQIQGGDVDGRVDVYALGCVLYQCLTGTPPFLRENEAALIYAHLLDPPPMLSETRSDLSPEIDAVIAKAMAKSREDRYPTAAALCAAARAALARDISTAHATTTPVALDPITVAPAQEKKLEVQPPLAKPKPAPAPEVKPVPTPELTPKPPPAKPSSPIEPLEAAGSSASRPGASRTLLRPLVILPVVALIVVLAAGAGLYFALGRTTPPTPSPSDSAQAGARGLVPADDSNGPARVADLLFPGVSAGSTDASPCGAHASDGYNSCPLTQKLATRLGERPVGSSDPLCRCDNGYSSVNTSVSPNDTGAIVHVTAVDAGGRSHAIDITVLKTNDGWVASDSTCTGQGSPTSIFSGNPTDCVSG